jgi:mRNA interferase MazF
VSKIITLEKTALGQYIGTLTEIRVNQILAGIRFLQTTFVPEE